MKNRTYFRTLGVALSIALLPAITGCATQALAANDLMTDIQPQTTNPAAALTDEQSATLSNFAVRLLQETSAEQGNILVSPLSVEHALGMTANGAKGETLTQIETTLGLPLDELNASLSASVTALKSDKAKTSEGGAASTAADAESPLKLANSLWIREGVEVERDFLQANANWYGAGAYEAPFDASTTSDINQWVSDSTDNMIENLVDEIPASAVLYLVNALAFNDTWATPYESEDVQDATFTTQDGTEQNAKLMYSTESLYLEGLGATGFIKRYEHPQYALATLLPNEGSNVDELVANLDGVTLQSLLSSAEYTTVDAALPKFESEFSTELCAPLAALGIQDAFVPEVADFTGISTDGNLSISRVLHKTYIAVDEKGTKAAAATGMEISATSAAPAPSEVKVVHLDRPFVYFIIDTETNLPVFAGITRSAE